LDKIRSSLPKVKASRKASGVSVENAEHAANVVLAARVPEVNVELVGSEANAENVASAGSGVKAPLAVSEVNAAKPELEARAANVAKAAREVRVVSAGNGANVARGANEGSAGPEVHAAEEAEAAAEAEADLVRVVARSREFAEAINFLPPKTVHLRTICTDAALGVVERFVVVDDAHVL
jgi:hypothetical protein